MTTAVLPCAAPPECGCQDYTPTSMFRIQSPSLGIFLLSACPQSEGPSSPLYQSLSWCLHPVYNAMLISWFVQQALLNYVQAWKSLNMQKVISLLSFRLLFVNMLPVYNLGKDDVVDVMTRIVSHYFHACLMLLFFSCSLWCGLSFCSVSACHLARGLVTRTTFWGTLGRL